MNWFYVLNGQQVGPVTQAQLEELAQSGTIKADTLVWREGLPNWLPYSQAMGGTAVAGQPPLMGQATAQPFGQTSPFGAVDSTEQARKAVQGPAIGLIVAGGIGSMISMLNLVQHVLGAAGQKEEMRRAFAELPPEAQPVLEFLEMTMGPLGIVLAILGLLICLFMAFAGIQMRQLKNYWMPLTAAILGIVSCFWGCCCVSLPIGIWAIVVLMKPEVKAAFR